MVRNGKHGFSLVELSIVLVILGLLTGGILLGKNLVRAAELRSINTQFGSYITAINLFKETYSALPGDMKNATSYWGIAAGTGSDATCQSFASTGKETCNGDGNGQIDNGANEMFRFWQHLANAGLIEGSYTGTRGTISAYHHVSGTNSPRSKFSSATWGTRYYHTTAAGSIFNIIHDSHMSFGGLDGNGWPHAPAITIEEVWNLDSKFDDGKPAQGAFSSGIWSGCTNAANRDAVTADYNLSTPNSLLCSVYYMQAY